MKNLFLFTYFSILSIFSYSQEKKPDKIDFGFYLEGHRTLILSADNYENSFGNGLGITMDYNFNKNISLVSTAGLSFNESWFRQDYTFQTIDVYHECFDLRMHGKFKFGKKASKPYLLVGTSTITPIIFKRPSLYYTHPNKVTTIAADFGIGFDKNFQLFRLAPEIRYSFGLNSVTPNINFTDITIHRISLTLHFKS